MKRVMRYFGATVIPLMLITGCATPESRIAGHSEAFNALPESDQTLIREGKIAIGFDERAVELALGEPDHVQRATTGNTGVTVWQYTQTAIQDDPTIYTGYYRDGVNIPNSNASGFYSASESAQHRGYALTANSAYYSRYHGSVSYSEADAQRTEKEVLRVVFASGKVSAIELR